jgi:N-acetylmuramoyl-L-alanine amidase
MTTVAYRSALVLALVAFGAPAAMAGKVVLDVGHYLERPGATSASGRSEFEFNRQLAMDMAAALAQRGVLVKVIGADGAMKRLSDRVRAARGTDLLLSVHHDSVQLRYLESWYPEGRELRFSDRYSGFSLFVSHKNPRLAESLACASAIGSALRTAGFRPSLYHAEAIRGEMKPFADRANGVHYYDNLVVLKGAATAAVLLEAGVIVNRDEEQDLARATTRARMGEAVAAGLGTCLGTRG